MKGRCVVVFNIVVVVVVVSSQLIWKIHCKSQLRMMRKKEKQQKSIRIILCVSQNDQQHYNKFMKSPTIEPHVNVFNCFTYSNNTLSKWFCCCLICIKFSEYTQFSTWGRTKNGIFFIQNWWKFYWIWQKVFFVWRVREKKNSVLWLSLNFPVSHSIIGSSYSQILHTKFTFFFPAKHKVHTSIPKMKKKMLSIFQHPLAVLSQYIEYICVYIYYILVYTRAWIFESSIFHNFYFTHTIKQTKNKHTIFFFLVDAKMA